MRTAADVVSPGRVFLAQQPSSRPPGSPRNPSGVMFMRRAILLALGGALLLGLSQGSVPLEAQGTSPSALSFFKNYIVTGDYVIGGIGLRGQGVNGIATGSIQISGVPAGADIAAAYLYWQVVSKDATPDSGSLAATFRNRPLASADGA